MARPALAALAEQQKTIQTQAAVIEQQDKAIANLNRVAYVQQSQIRQLAAAVQTTAQLAGVELQFRTAMKKFADSQNPAQPVPEPPAVPATESTPQAETPEAMADVQSPGLVPGTTNDVAADAVSTAYTPGMDIPGPAFNNLQDVTAPVDGTQNPRPLSEVKTLTDVRVGDPMNPQTGFPLRGPFQNAQRTSAKQDGGAPEDAGRRTMASIRLARLRMAAGLAEGENDLAVAATIEKDASLPLEAIEREIVTLDQVKTASAKRANQGGRNERLVPRTARQRAVPSMQGGGSPGITATAAAADPDDASDLFD